MINNKLKIAALVTFSALSLSACGSLSDLRDELDLGSSDGGNQDGDQGGNQDGSIEAEGDRLFDLAESAAPTSVANMPQAGRATYTGLAGFEDANEANMDDPGLYSKVEMTADFAAQTVAGSFYDFGKRHADAPTVSGAMTMENGTFATDGNGNQTFQSDLGGQLTVEGHAVTASGNLEGAFGNDASVVAGGVMGTMTDANGEDMPFVGLFAAD